MAGYNWVRFNATASDGSSGNTGIAINMDVHDASAGVSDDWMFYGDSITQDGFGHDTRLAANGTTVGTFAQLVSAQKPGYFPAYQDGGIGGLLSADGASNINTWLALFPGKYVTLNYGTNDAANASAGDPTIAQTFYNNMQTMVKAVIAAGKTPIIPTIPWARLATVQANAPVLNNQTAALEVAYPQIVKGPDLFAFFKANPGLISGDNLHPSWDNGYAAMRQQWANWAISTIGG
jgi:lysophospholipase L1-like esterase